MTVDRHISVYRFGVHHFVNRVPSDVRKRYRSARVSMTLSNMSEAAAARFAQSITQRVDDHCYGLRLQRMGVLAN